MIDFFNEANSIKDELINIRRDIHMHPEIGFEEERTSKIIKNFLWYEGIEYKNVAGTGICAIINGNNHNNRVIAARADIDALPLVDKKDCYYKSKIQGKMHACGHDAHTAILLGVARIMNRHKDEFSGTIKLLFEPAEETSGGAPIMIREGVLENPHVDAIIGLHVSEDVDCGKISIKEGMVNAASNPFKITVRGVSSHGASPQLSIDPIVISSHIITAIQNIVSRETSPLKPTVVTIGSIHGGTAMNIIPEEVVLEGTIRTITDKDREFVTRRLRDIVQNILRSFRAEGDIEIEEGYPLLYNNSNMISILRSNAENIIGRENIIIKREPSMGVESFAYFANACPSVFYYLGTRNEEKNTDRSAHTNYFDIDEDAIPIGVAIQCSIMYDYLTRC